jgi:transposase, IS5 family
LAVDAPLCRHRPPPSRGQALGRQPVPDETTVCRFRHLLEGHDLGRRLFDEVQRHLAAKGLKLATGTIVDATMINAPSSTKNADKARDPEMHQTNKGNQWYFAMKGHFGVDSRTKLIHTVVTTPANVADNAVLPRLLHGNETRVWGDQAYRGQRAVIRQHAPRAKDFVNRRYRRRGVVDEVERAKNRTKSKVRAKSLPSRKRGSSIRSGSSSECLVLPKCAIAGSKRMLIACS